MKKESQRYLTLLIASALAVSCSTDTPSRTIGFPGVRRNLDIPSFMPFHDTIVDGNLTGRLLFLWPHGRLNDTYSDPHLECGAPHYSFEILIIEPSDRFECTMVRPEKKGEHVIRYIVPQNSTLASNLCKVVVDNGVSNWNSINEALCFAPALTFKGYFLPNDYSWYYVAVPTQKDDTLYHQLFDILQQANVVDLSKSVD